MNPRPIIIDHPARILIVDDEPVNRQLLDAMLAPEGFVLVGAGSGEAALAAVELEPPDLVLLDIMMPGMDGYEVVSRIKGNPATKNIPVIMVTALDDREARLHGLRAGAEDFLSKPVDRAELCARVRNLLQLKSYGDYYDKYSQLLENEVAARTADVRRERDRAQRYLDTASVMLVALDTAGRVTLVNRFACRVLGWTEPELIGRDWFDTCIVPRHGANAVAGFRNLLAGDASVTENIVLTRSGEERRIEWHSTVVRVEDGLIAGTFSSGTDITDRHDAVTALRVAEERMRFALRNAGVGIWDMDCATQQVRWSDNLEAQYGLLPDTFGGDFAAFLERIHPEDRESVIATTSGAMVSGADFTVLNRALWADGTIRWLSGAGRFVLGEDGNAVRGVGISQDVTERRELEGRYQQAQKMESIGRLASGVAHDFNNLLTVVLGCAELVNSDPALGARHRDDLGEIIKAAQRAARLTRQLLAFGRQQVLLALPLDVNRLIADMTGMLGRLIGEQITITMDLAPGNNLTLADRGQVEQVVMNLVVNARDAMPDGGVITVTTAEVELESSFFRDEAIIPGKYTMIAITDSGTGMTLETQRRIFEPFFTTKETGKGTGLGLSTTYGIVRQSKGYVWVYSELGHGTTFKVYLPRSTDGAPSAVSTAIAPAARIGASASVLLVEDEPSVRRFAKRILDDAGFRVLEAADAEEAEAIFANRSSAIDLLVTDVALPGLSGPELVSRLRLVDKDLRVLYMSGYAEESMVQKAGIDRGQPFVEKPFTAADFDRHVREALTR